MKKLLTRHATAVFLATACMLGMRGISANANPAPFATDGDTLALWHFDQLTDKNVAQDTGGTSTISGGVEADEGKYGQALRFNGADGKLTAHFPKMLQIGANESCTIEAWIQVTKAGTSQPIYSLPPYFEFEVRNSSGAISFNFASADGKSSVRATGKTNVVTGEWHHVAGVRDAKDKKVRVYVDGQLDGEADDTTAGSALVVGESALIGSNASGTETFGGTIDELRISRIARVIPKMEAAPVVEARKVTLENDHVQFVFNVAGSTVSLGSMVDKASGQEFIEPSVKAMNIWQAQMRSPTRDVVVINETTGKLDVQTNAVDGGKRLDMKWAGLPIAGKPGLADVAVSVTLADDSRLADWRINVANRSDTYGLWTAIFPRISNFAKLSDEGKDVMAIPGGNGGGAGEGQVYPDPFKTLTHIFLRTYPCYFQSMQFNAYYNDKAGLYLATHDGKMNLKGFLLHPRASLSGEKPTVLYETHLYPADAGVAGTSIVQDYPHYIGTFKGDWYDVCKIYRQWALKQVWAQKGPLEKRDDISPFIQKGAYWMVGTLEWEPSDKPALREKFRQMPFDEAVKNARVLDVDKSFQAYKHIKEYFDFPLLFWTNEWFDGGGDLAPPRYIHQRKLPELLKRIHTELKDTYVSGHMQMKRFSIQLPEYKSNPAWQAAVAGNADGTKQIEAMGALAEDRFDQHGYMCWYTDYWKDFWTKKSASIVAETGLDGFHVDELAVGMNHEYQCFDRSHGHQVGGGTYWADTRRANTKMLRDSVRTVKPTFAIHHEAMCEIYIDVADLAEVCTSPSNTNLPLWHAVYHDYNFSMGRRIHPWMDRRTFNIDDKEKFGDNDIDQFNASFAQTYVWGNQPGWTRMDILEYSPKVAALIKEWTHIRNRNLKYINTGEFIRPLTIKTPQEMIKTIWTTNDTPEHIQPAVLNSVWKASDGTIGIVLANTTGQARKINYAYDLSENGGKVGKWKLVRTDGPEQADVATVDGDTIERTDEVPARSVIILSAIPVK